MPGSSVEPTSPVINEIAKPWKIGSKKMTPASATTAGGVRSVGRKRTPPVIEAGVPYEAPAAQLVADKVYRRRFGIRCVGSGDELEHLNIVDAGRADPVKKIVLASETRNVKLKNGDGLLLRLNAASHD